MLYRVFQAVFITTSCLACNVDKKTLLHLLPFPQEEKQQAFMEGESTGCFFPLEVTAIPHVCCCASSRGDVWPVPTGDQAAACARELVEPPARLGGAEGAKAALKVGFTPLIAGVVSGCSWDALPAAVSSCPCWRCFDDHLALNSIIQVLEIPPNPECGCVKVAVLR